MLLIRPLQVYILLSITNRSEPVIFFLQCQRALSKSNLIPAVLPSITISPVDLSNPRDIAPERVSPSPYTPSDVTADDTVPRRLSNLRLPPGVGRPLLRSPWPKFPPRNLFPKPCCSGIPQLGLYLPEAEPEMGIRVGWTGGGRSVGASGGESEARKGPHQG